MSAPPGIGMPPPLDPRVRPRSRLILLLVLALFAGPLIASFVLYYGMHWRPAGQTNHGTLIQPPRPLPLTGQAALLRGKWSLVYIGAGSCDQDCRSTVYFIRQTYLGLAQLMPRAQQVFLVTSACCDDAWLEREDPQLITVNLGSPGNAEGDALLQLFPQDQRATTVFVVDPKGNLMMRYDAHSAPHGLHDDLHKLLSLSHIG